MVGRNKHQIFRGQCRPTNLGSMESDSVRDRQTDRQTARDRQTDRQRQIDKQMRERDREGQVAQDCVKATGEHLERKEVDSKQKVC